MNVQSHMVRDLGDVQADARFGVPAAWLLVFEVFVGGYSREVLVQRNLQVTPEHL